MVQPRFVQPGPVRLQYFEHGRGSQVLVFVHGYQTSGRIWKLTQEALAPSRFRTIAVSNRGAGDSARGTSEENYTVQAFARDLLNTVNTLGLRDFTLVGHSMGGATVAQFALDHPELLKGLVLMNSTPLHGRPLAADWENQIRSQFAQDAPPRVNFGPKAAELPADFIRGVEGDVARNPIERALGGRRSMSQLRLREQLHRLPVPVLVIGGDLDTIVGVDNILADYLALAPERRYLHVFHGVGHSPNVETHIELAALLDSFVSRVSSLAGQRAPAAG